MSIDSVVVEAIFLRLSALHEPALQKIWNEIDEQSIDIAVRRQLDANGVRAGIITGELPSELHQWLAEADRRLKEDTLEQARIGADVSSHVQRLQCRNGRKKELIVQRLSLIQGLDSVKPYGIILQLSSA